VFSPRVVCVEYAVNKKALEEVVFQHFGLPWPIIVSPVVCSRLSSRAGKFALFEGILPRD
jgi:hypothetical protein